MVTPMVAWVGLPGTSGNLKRASNILTRRFGSARTIQLWLIGTTVKRPDYFGLKQYDQTIESARRAIAISPNIIRGRIQTSSRRWL